MSDVTIYHEEPPEAAVTNAERIAREGVADSVTVEPAVDDWWVLEVRGLVDDLSESEFEQFNKRITSIIEPGHEELDTFYPTRPYDTHYLIRFWY